MNCRTLALLLTGLALGCSAQAEPSTSSKQALPDIKKGVRVVFRTPIETYAQHRGYEDPIVEEVRGHWVRMKFEPGEQLKKEGDTVRTIWVNFDTVNHYYVIQ